MDVKIAVIGCGHWGRNLVRNFCALLGPEKVICCDQDQATLDKMTAEFPGITTTINFGLVLNRKDVAGVAVATPASSHHHIARTALMAGKHVLVEKPMTMNEKDASELCEISQDRRRVLMVDHVLLFHPVVQELERTITSGELGDIFHYYSRRTNLGILRTDENVLWSLAPHDIAVMAQLAGAAPTKVTAHGASFLQTAQGIHDVVFVSLLYPLGQVGHLHLSWLDPHKSREIVVIGSKKMAVFDDMESQSKLRMYSYTYDIDPLGGTPSLRPDGVEVREVPFFEPLSLACREFLTAMDKGIVSISSGSTGRDVVQVLEAAQSSLDLGGAVISL